MNDLNPLEVRLLESCRDGVPLICDSAVSQTIRAEVIRTLCLGLRSDWPAPRGVKIKGATIEGQVDLEDGNVATQLILDGCVLPGGLDLRFARAALIDLTRSQLGPVLAARVFIKDNFCLPEALIREQFELRQAVIEGQLFADDLKIEAQVGKVAIAGDGIRVDGDVFLRRCEIQGEIRFPGAQIGGNLEFDGARLDNPQSDDPNRFALNLERLTVGGSVFLRFDGKSQRSFRCAGQVRLLGGRIGDELSCAGAAIENASSQGDSDPLALTCDRLQVGGTVFLRSGFSSRGAVRFAGARIGSNLDLNGASLENPKGYALYALDVQVKGALRLNGLARKPVGRVNLDHSGTHVFADDEASWPEPGMLEINGFTYHELEYTSPTKATKRLEWLRLQPKSPFRPQPYEQLVKVLRGMGHLSDANSILVAKQDDLRAYGELRGWERFKNWFLGATIGHGYMPLRVGGWILGSIILGWLCYGFAYCYGVLMVNNGSSRELAAIHLLILAIDKFLPIVDLGSSAGWHIDTTRLSGSLVQLFELAYMLIGWFFTALAAAALAGLMKKE